MSGRHGARWWQRWGWREWVITGYLVFMAAFGVATAVVVR